VRYTIYLMYSIFKKFSKCSAGDMILIIIIEKPLIFCTNIIDMIAAQFIEMRSANMRSYNIHYKEQKINQNMKQK
jgi:hypothetical protein